MWYRVTNMFLYQLDTELPTCGHGSFSSGHWWYCNLKLALICLILFFSKDQKILQKTLFWAPNHAESCDASRPAVSGRGWLDFFDLWARWTAPFKRDIAAWWLVNARNAIEHKYACCRPLTNSSRLCLCLVDVSSGSRETNTLTHTEPTCFLSQQAVQFGAVSCWQDFCRRPPRPLPSTPPPYLFLCPHFVTWRDQYVVMGLIGFTSTMSRKKGIIHKPQLTLLISIYTRREAVMKNTQRFSPHILHSH